MTACEKGEHRRCARHGAAHKRCFATDQAGARRGCAIAMQAVRNILSVCFAAPCVGDDCRVDSAGKIDVGLDKYALDEDRQCGEIGRKWRSHGRSPFPRRRATSVGMAPLKQALRSPMATKHRRQTYADCWLLYSILRQDGNALDECAAQPATGGRFRPPPSYTARRQST